MQTLHNARPTSPLQGHSVRIVYILRLLRLVRVARLVNGLQPGSSGGASGPLKVHSSAGEAACQGCLPSSAGLKAVCGLA